LALYEARRIFVLSFKSHLHFFAAFLANPHGIGAVAPSSQALCQRMLEWIAWDQVRVVVEYGPGTGVFTERIVSMAQPGTVIIAIELNPDFAMELKRRYPGVRVYQDSVIKVSDVCDREGIAEVDAVVSGLPWALCSQADQQRYLEAMLTVLRPSGQFVTFAYLQGLLLQAGRRFQHTLRQTFADVTSSRTVWLNMPPAFVYRCRR
jgi:phosphatidylethanolamine/phosphatidyl-N-methylethanolamine N-methyltransferase